MQAWFRSDLNATWAAWSLIRRNPWTWVLLSLPLVTWAAWSRLEGIGIALADTIDPPAYEIAFLSALAGVCLGAEAVRRLRGCFEACSWRRRLRTELGVLLFSAVLFQLAALCPIPWLARDLSLTQLVKGVFLADLHLCGMALVLLRTPAEPIGLWLLITAWLLPAAVPEPSAQGFYVRSLLGAFTHLMSPWRDRAGVVDMMPVCAWIGAAALIARAKLRPP